MTHDVADKTSCYLCSVCANKLGSKQGARRKARPRKRTKAMSDDELIENYKKDFGSRIIPFRAIMKKAKLTPSQKDVLGNVAPVSHDG